MGRSAYHYFVRDLHEAKDIAENILKKNKFSQITMRSGEIVWRRGTGIVMAQQYVSLYYVESENRVIVYAWTRSFSGIPGMGEREIESLGAAMPGKMLAKVVAEIETELEKIRL